MKIRNEHAIVIGGSITGCMVSELLSKKFHKVTIIEGGDFSPDTSKGVPQSDHAHIVLITGMKIINKIFPGTNEELEENGAVSLDITQDLKWFQLGRWKKNFASNIYMYFFSRNLLDSIARKRIKKNKKIHIYTNTKVKNLEYSYVKEKATVTGVNISSPTGIDNIDGDLIIDCTGFTSQTPEWLFNEGLGQVKKTQIKTELGYASRVYQSTASLPHQAIAIWLQTKKVNHIGLLLPIENGKWIVSAGGNFNDFPSPDNDSYLSFIKSLPSPKIYEMIKNAKPMTDIKGFKYSGSHLFHYDKMEKFPDGLIVLGAALAGVNPFYGQGITLCAKQTMALYNNIDRWIHGQCTTKKIQKRFLKTITNSWMIGLMEDLRYSRTNQKINVALKILLWYSDLFSLYASTNEFGRKIQIEIIQLISSPLKIFHPKIIYGILIWKISSHKNI